MSSSESDSIETRLDRVAKASALFAQRATALSETIERVATSLLGLAGKTASHIKDKDSRVEVAFDKLPTWGLWVLDDDSPEEEFGHQQYEALVTVSIPRKTRAFPLLAPLLATIEADQRRQIAEIDSAIGLLQGPAGTAGNDSSSSRPGVEGVRAGAVRGSANRPRSRGITFEYGPDDADPGREKGSK